MVRAKLDIQRKSYGFRLNTEIVKRLKTEAIKQERPVNVMIEEAIEDLLKKGVKGK